ncbi:MAG: HEAT repeat domain-containing protein [bacterium]
MERIENNTPPGATAALIHLLGSENDYFRCLAARGLGRIGTPAALEPLIERLWDEDEDVSQDAALALGDLADLRAVDALCEFYAMVELPELKVAAVEALGRLGGPKAAELLLTVARTRDPSWGGIGPENWDGYWDAQLKAVEALGTSEDARAVSVLAGLLDDEEGQDISAQVLVALARMGAPGKQVLLERLWNSAPIEQRRAAELLAAQFSGNATAGNDSAGEASAEVVATFLAGVAHPEGEVRAAMLRALAAVGETLPKAKVQALLKDPHPEVRVQAAGFLAHFPPDETAAEWFRLAKDPEPVVRKAALEALTLLGVRAALPLLRKGVEDPSLEVVLSSLSGLAALEDTESLPLLAGLLDQERQESEKRVAPAVRVGAVSALQALATPQARALLQTGLTGPDSPVRMACLRSLACLHGREAGAFLASVLRGELVGDPGLEGQDAEPVAAHPSGDDPVEDSVPEDSVPADAPPEDRTPPMSTLEAIQREPAFDSDIDSDIYSGANRSADSSLGAAVEGGVQLDEEQREFLRENLKNQKINERLLKPQPHPVHLDLRVLAARLIGEGGYADAEAALLEALEHPGDALRKEAAEVLGEIGGGQAVPGLLPLLESENWEVRLAAVRALGRLGAPSSVRALLDARDEPHPIVRREVVSALATENSVEVTGMLRSALGDENAGVFKAAALALLGRGEAALLFEIVAGMERHPGHNWDGLGRALAKESPEDGRRWIIEMLTDPALARVVPLTVGLLEELELADGTLTEPH